MLLSLFRLTMIVSLLISAVCIEARVESRESKAVAEASRGDPFASEDESSIERKRHLSRNSRMSSEHNSRLHGVHAMDGRVSRSGNENLARKMAKDALKSPKMQETMKKLSRGGDPKQKKLFVSVKVPSPPKGGSRLAGNSDQSGRQSESKGRRRKKKKRHHRRHRKLHPGWPRSGSAKRTLTKGREVSAKRLSGNEGSHSKRNQLDKLRAKNEHSVPTDKITAVKADDTDYVDVPTTPNDKLTKNDDSAKLRETGGMIERLMKTTTGNPSKEGPGDQGIEYSDYYSEDDVLQDIAANKIPANAAETTNPDRFIRQTLNATSYRRNNQIQPCYQAARNRDFGQADYPINSFNGFQQYPTVERRATLSRNTRHRGTDDSSLYYDPSYVPLDDRIENSPYAFSTMVPEWVPGTSGLNDNFMVPELRNNFDASDPNLLSEEMQRAVAVPPNADQLDFLGRNGKPLDVVDPLTVLQSPNTVAEVPQLSHKLAAFELQNLNNYHRGTGLQRLNNIDQNVYSQPRLGAIPTVDEGIGHFQSKDYNFLPVQDNNNDLPAVNVPNAMNQPLGKVLQSLGINVHVDSPASNKENSISPTYRNNGVDDANDASLSHFETHDRPVDHDPTNCDKDDTRQTNEKNGNTNLRGSQRRRHLAKKGSQSSNLFSLLEGEGNSNSSDTVHDTKEIASQVLDTIMEELQELKLDSSKNDKKEGSWSTAQAGVKLNMKVVNHNIIVTFSDIASPRYHESLLNGTWNVSGHAPLKRGSPFTLTATDNTTNSMAVFIGACKVCQGIDTIAGVWSIARSPKDCRDFQVATSVFNDIFRKSKLSSLKETKNSKNATAEQKKKRS